MSDEEMEYQIMLESYQRRKKSPMFPQLFNKILVVKQNLEDNSEIYISAEEFGPSNCLPALSGAL
jgi:hypothetical protein